MKISVVIPTYNRARFLGEAITSIQEQEWPETELIVVDGGSTDGTADLLENRSGEITWWVSEADSGQSHAVNKGLEHCTGDLVAFIGADDLYLPGAFSDAVSRYEKNQECGAVVGGFIRVDEETRVISDPVPATYPWNGPVDLMLAALGSWRLHQVSTFFSRRALDRVGGHVEETLEYTMDRELLNRVCRRFRVVTSPRVYAAFRDHRHGKSTSDILPFSRELAALHLRDVPRDEAPGLRRRRRALARRQLVGGYLKLARISAPGWKAVRALAAVPFVLPATVGRRSYIACWFDAIGIGPVLRRLRGAPTHSTIDRRPLTEVIHEL